MAAASYELINVTDSAADRRLITMLVMQTTRGKTRYMYVQSVCGVSWQERSTRAPLSSRDSDLLAAAYVAWRRNPV